MGDFVDFEVCIDSEVKEQAEALYNNLGLTLLYWRKSAVIRASSVYRFLILFYHYDIRAQESNKEGRA